MSSEWFTVCIIDCPTRDNSSVNEFIDRFNLLVNKEYVNWPVIVLFPDKDDDNCELRFKVCSVEDLQDPKSKVSQQCIVDILMDHGYAVHEERDGGDAIEI